MDKKVIHKCPWSIQENLISKFILNNNDTNFHKIFDTMNKNSSHSEFWIEIYKTILEYKELQNKYKHLIKEYTKLEDEYENYCTLNQIN